MSVLAFYYIVYALSMDTDSSVVKTWGEGGSRVKEVNGEKRGILVMLLIIKIN